MARGLLIHWRDSASRVPNFVSIAIVDSMPSERSSRVRMTVEWLVPDGQARSVTMALQSVSSETRMARGSTGCTVSTRTNHGVTVKYVEEWRSEDNLRDHVRSATFAKLISLIEASIRPPRIEFALPDGVRGLDYVTEVRESLA